MSDDSRECTFDTFHHSQFSSSTPEADKNVVLECVTTSTRVKVQECLSFVGFLFVASDANKVQGCSLSVSQVSALGHI